MGEILQREGVNNKVVEIFYRVVVQVVILFVSRCWVLLAAMERTVEGTHTGFLRQITENRARRRTDKIWSTPVVEDVREVMGTHLAKTFIN